jgi:hypothetical protein
MIVTQVSSYVKNLIMLLLHSLRQFLPCDGAQEINMREYA